MLEKYKIIFQLFLVFVFLTAIPEFVSAQQSKKFIPDIDLVNPAIGYTQEAINFCQKKIAGMNFEELQGEIKRLIGEMEVLEKNKDILSAMKKSLESDIITISYYKNAVKDASRMRELPMAYSNAAKIWIILYYDHIKAKGRDRVAKIFLNEVNYCLLGIEEVISGINTQSLNPKDKKMIMDLKDEAKDIISQIQKEFNTFPR